MVLFVFWGRTQCVGTVLNSGTAYYPRSEKQLFHQGHSFRFWSGQQSEHAPSGFLFTPPCMSNAPDPNKWENISEMFCSLEQMIRFELEGNHEVHDDDTSCFGRVA